MTSYRVPSRVAYVVADEGSPTPGTVYLMTLPDGAPAVLRDSAAVIWTVAVDGGEADVGSAVGAAVGLPTEQVAPDVERFLAELVAMELLEVEDSLDEP